MTFSSPFTTIIHLCEQLGRHRALTEEEAAWLDRSIKRGNTARRRNWSQQEDDSLMKAVRAGIKQPQIATTLGRPNQSVYSRLKQLRKRERARDCINAQARGQRHASDQ